MNGLEKFYFDHKEPNTNVFLALKDVILVWGKDLEQCLKYGLPYFTYTQTE
jgi:hypothetical protein